MRYGEGGAFEGVERLPYAPLLLCLVFYLIMYNSYRKKIMDKNKKIEYVVKYLIWIWLNQEKIEPLKEELLAKDESFIDDILQKLSNYYEKQNFLDKEYIKKLEKLNNDFDEKIEKTIDEIVADNIINY